MNKIYIILFFSLILVSCRDSETKPGYHMIAQVNNMNWSSDDRLSSVQLTYNFNKQAHYAWISSQTQNPLADGVRYQIDIFIDRPIAKGKFYFNNNGLTRSELGATGGVYGWKRNGIDEYFYGSSINGYVEVTNLTKEDISGVFEFAAVTHKSSFHLGNDTIVVQGGEFYVPIGAISGKDWEGPK